MSKWIPVAFIVALMLTGTGCKSRKKASAITNVSEEKAKMEKEEALRKQQEEEMQRKREAEEAAAKAKAEADAKAASPKVKLNQYFDAIANAGNVASANSSINEAMTLFASPETPVLIVISDVNGQKDYDRPTTIKNYLNYLKDQKKNINKISSLEFDDNGKIKTVELTK